MKALLKLALALFMLAVGQLASAAPFVIVDVPSLAADRCLIANPSTAPAVESAVVVDAAYGNPANGNRICAKIDAATAPVGDTTIAVQLKSDLWGVTGAAIPFSFTRPSPGALVPAGIELRK